MNRKSNFQSNPRDADEDMFRGLSSNLISVGQKLVLRIHSSKQFDVT